MGVDSESPATASRRAASGRAGAGRTADGTGTFW
jgi:hypothetical protein